MKTIIYLFFLFLAFACQRSVYFQTNTKKYTYRNPIAPLEHIPLGKQMQPTMKNAYLQWQVEHDNIVQSLEQNKLAVYEAHRRVQYHLDTMISIQSPRIARQLQAYQKLYNNLLDEVEKRVPTRILENKYRHLKREIQNIFTMETL